MNDKELADKVLEIFSEDIWYFADWLDLESWTELHGEDAFKQIMILDWRVAGALMERVRKMGVHQWWRFTRNMLPHLADVESLPRAIIEACVEGAR